MSAAEDLRRNLRWIASRLVDASVAERLLVALSAIALSLLVSAVIILAAGYDPTTLVIYLVYGALSTPSQIAFMLRKTTMLILAGVAVAIAFRASVFNIGVQGQLVVGGFTAAMAILGLAPLLPTGSVSGVVLVSVGLFAGVLGGAIYAAVPGVMKAYADANEVITTIMLNFIATGALFVLVDGPLKEPGVVAPKTVSFPEYAGFPAVVFDSSTFSALALALALVVAFFTYVVMTNTTFGYDLRTSGQQATAAAFSGVNPRRMIVSTMVFSGMVAGLCGAVYVVMVVGYYQDPGTIPTFGFDAIAVSLLAANNPLGVVPSGLLFGGLAAGQQFVDVNTNIPSELIDGIVGLVVLFVATPELFRMAGKRLDVGSECE